MNRHDKFGFGIVGAGMAARPHALALKALAPDVEVRGVFTRGAERRAAFCAEYGFSQAGSLDALLADDGVDALLVLTPPNARAEIVAAAAAAGKPLLMEKPVERTTEAAEAIVAACEKAGVALGIVFQHRFRAGSRRLAAMLADGALGDIVAVQLVVPWWRAQSYYDEPGRGTLARDGGGVLISQAIHPLDLMLSLTGPVESVQAVAATTRTHRMETEDFVGAGLVFANGAPGALIATTAHFPGGQEYLVLDCAQATATLAGNRLSIRWRDGHDEEFGETSGSGGGADPMAFPFDWHQAQIEDFVDAVRTGRDPVSTGRTALRVHRLIDALIASSRDGRRVEVVGD